MRRWFAHRIKALLLLALALSILALSACDAGTVGPDSNNTPATSPTPVAHVVKPSPWRRPLVDRQPWTAWSRGSLKTRRASCACGPLFRRNHQSPIRQIFGGKCGAIIRSRSSTTCRQLVSAFTPLCFRAT